MRSASSRQPYCLTSWVKIISSVMPCKGSLDWNLVIRIPVCLGKHIQDCFNRDCRPGNRQLQRNVCRWGRATHQGGHPAILCPILLAFPLSGSWIAYKRGRVKLGVIITSVLFVMMTLRLRLIISEVKALVSEKHGPDCQNFILFLVL